ncbi:porphobilinogen deaminase [Elasticomyces elasticus]|nr:porphobilinogen deaminase [Elasticomyces elasticus]
MASVVEASPSDSPSTQTTVNIGTRRSALARIQADTVEKALKEAWPENKYVVHAMSTMGDKDQTTALHEFNAKALWTHELEALLDAGDLDLVVHSLKDMPTQLPQGLSIGCICPREDARDALVVKPTLSSTYKSLAALPAGSVIGTSSVRRSAQIKRLYPHLRFADVRGNLGTRLAKLDNPDSEYAALILAAAGLKRLGMEQRITAYLTKNDGGMLYAVGQGALGIEIRQGDARIKTLLSKVGCEKTTRACLAERSLLRTLEGGCSVPIGVETEWVKRSSLEGPVGAKPAAEYHQISGVAKEPQAGPSGAARDGQGDMGDQPAKEHEQMAQMEMSGQDDSDVLVMRAVVVSLDGSEAVEVETRRYVASRADADEYGWDVARRLVEKGADKILEKINLNRKIIEKQGDA